MHPELYAELAADRICTLRREADAQRLADLAARPRRVTLVWRARQISPFATRPARGR